MEDRFKAAGAHYVKLGKGFSYSQKMKLYALHKQAVNGDAEGTKPRDLFNSWKVNI